MKLNTAALAIGVGGLLVWLLWSKLAAPKAGSYDPNAVGVDRQTPPSQFATLSNPVQASPAVLPYSYKQATIDIASLLSTNDLFTPGAGSAGGYVDSGNTPGAGYADGSSWA